MKNLIQEVLKRFQTSKSQYLKIKLGKKNHLELEKKEEKEPPVFSAPVSTPITKTEPEKKESKTESPQEAKSINEEGTKITSYYVGRFKSLKEPLKGGEVINKNEVLGTIESMGIIHEVLSPAKGVLIEVNVKNEDIVEYEQVLFQLKEEK